MPPNVHFPKAELYNKRAKLFILSRGMSAPVRRIFPTLCCNTIVLPAVAGRIYNKFSTVDPTIVLRFVEGAPASVSIKCVDCVMLIEPPIGISVVACSNNISSVI